MTQRILIIFGLTLSALAFGQVPTTNLVGEYKFTNGRLDDAIGSNDLTQTGSTLVVVANRAGGPTKAISLNGDKLQRVNASHFAITASYWVKTSTNDANKRVIIDQTERTTDTETSTNTGWYTYLQNGKVGVTGNFEWYHSNNTAAGATGYVGYQHLISSASVNDNNWHHVAITMHARWYNWLNAPYQRFERIIECTYNLYVDGVLQGTLAQQKNVGSAPSPAMRRFTNSSNMAITIGDIRTGASTSKYEDLFDDFRYYSGLLNATEIGQLASEMACSGTSGVTAVTQDITIQLDATGNASIAPADIDNGSSAVCDEPFILSVDKSSFTCADLGFNIVTLTATEIFATQAVSTATATVTVTYLPEVITQNITVQLDGVGNATITPAEINNGSASTGICEATLNFSLDKTTFTCADIGVNTVTLTADDGNGNTNTAIATVTVEDTVVPNVIAQNVAVTVDAALGFVTVNTAMVDNGSTDNCDTGALIMSLSKTKFRCEDTGDNIVTLTVEDAHGNLSTADVTVTVTSAINDETISATVTSLCPDGTSGSIISTGSSVVGFNYTLRNSTTNSVVAGPTAGTGSALDFDTGNLSATTTFNVFSEKELGTTQSALNFDGVNDYVSLGTNDRGVTTQVTVAAWIKTTASGASQFITSKYDFTNGYYLYIDANGKAGISGRDGSGAGRGSGFSSKSVNDGEWHYVAGSINIATGDWSIYVDGVLENMTNNGTGPTLVNAASLFFGLTSGLYFTGEMDQVTIWNTALDAAAIQSNMNTCLTGSETNIVGHFVFEDGTGTILTDQSASTINGTLVNMDGATDWVQVVSPSCGEKICNYQLSTEITIGDAIAPTAVAQNITAPIDPSTGEVTITASMIDNGSTDNCSTVLTKSVSTATFGCGDVGDQVVTLFVEDESGNTATAQATVTVTSPIVDETVTTTNTGLCPDGSIATISTGSSVVGVDYYLRNSSNNAIKDGPIAGTGAGLDFSTGNISSTSTFNVYAQLTPPVNSALDFDGINDYVAVDVPTFTYNTGYTIESWVKVAIPVGGNWPIFSIGNGSLSDIEVYVQSGTNHLIVVHDRGEPATFGGYSYTIPPNNQWFHLAVTYDGTSAIKVYYDGIEQSVVNSTFAPTGSLTKTAGQTIKIGRVDNTAFGAGGAVFSGQLDEVRLWNATKTSVEILANKNNCLTGSETGLAAYYNFNEGSSLTATDIVNGNNGTLTNMDAATDWITSGVAITCGAICDFQMTTEITMGDNTAPTAVAQDITIQLDATGNATVLASAVNNVSSDNCSTSGSLVLSLDKTNFTCADLGANTVTLTVEDTAGNQSSTTATVTVVDGVAPTAVAQNMTVQLDASGNTSIIADDVNNGSTDNCTAGSSLVLSLDKTAFTCADVGTNTVTLIVEDTSGNQGTATATVTVEDITAPTAVAQDITVQLDGAGNVTITGTEVNNGSSDVCTAANSLVFSLNKTAFTCVDLGANTVTFTVENASGNQSTATATVTVVDNLAPVAVAQDITLQLDATGNVSLTADNINDGSSDNCTASGDLIMSLDITSFTIADLGANTVTLTVEDANGNSSTTTATVTIEEKTVQTITFGALADVTYGESFNLTATSNSGLPVSYEIISGPATVSSSMVNIVGIGSVTIEATQAGNANFAVAPAVQQSFIVTQAVLTAAANNQAITYGDAIPALTFNYSGFVNGESATVLTTEPTITTTATTSSDAGSYAITLTGGMADNYAFTLVGGILTIGKIDQTISIETIVDKFTTDAAFDVVASSPSGLTLNYSISSGPATINGTTITLDGTEGTVVVEVTQAGDVNFNPTSTTTSFGVTVPCAGLTISVASTTDVVAGNDGAADISVTGGTAPYNFSWNNGDDSEDLSSVTAGTYTVTVTDANGCVQTETLIIGDIITSDIDALEANFNYYPNPVKEVMIVEISLGKASDIEIQLLDISGRVMQVNEFKNKRTLNTQLDVQGLGSGQYLLMVTTENTRRVERITITK